MTKIFTAPDMPKDGELDGYNKVFLAGTIDNGSSENWQKQVVDSLSGTDFKFAIFNPRRDNWKQNASTMEVTEQILWEQKMLKQSDMIVMMLLDGSQSPISLMELGQYASSNKIVVFCTEKFHRFTNVKVICELYKIPLFMTNNVEVVKFITTVMNASYGEVKTEYCFKLWEMYLRAIRDRVNVGETLMEEESCQKN